MRQGQIVVITKELQSGDGDPSGKVVTTISLPDNLVKFIDKLNSLLTKVNKEFGKDRK